MTDLEQAQVWTELSSHTLGTDEKTAPVIFSQYKTLYKTALKSVKGKEEPMQCCAVGGAAPHDDAIIKMLDDYKRCLEGYQGILNPIVKLKHENENRLVLTVREVAKDSVLMNGIKKEVKDILDTMAKELIKEFNMTEIKTMLSTIQTDKANEASVVKIGDTLAAMQTKLEMLSSKFGNSTLGALAEQVNSGSDRIKAMEASHEKLRESVDGLFASLRTHTTEVKRLQSDLGNSNRSMDDMTKLMEELNTSVGSLTNERKLLTDEIQKLGEAYSTSTNEIKARLVNVETSSNTVNDIAKRLQQIETSYATIEDVQDLVARLSTDETQNTDPPQSSTNESAAARAKGSLSPPLNPYARNARPGQAGMSKIAKERGLPPAVSREGSTSISPPRRTVQPSDARPPFR